MLRSDRRVRLARMVAVALALGLAAAPARAGPVILLKSRSLPSYDASVAGFRAAYGEGAIELSLETTTDEELERAVARARPDAIVAIGLRAALTAHARLPRTPLVFCAVQAADHHRVSGEWATGVATEWSARAELGALKVAAPDVRRVAIFFDAEAGSFLVRQARRAAREAGLTLVEAPIRSLEELGNAARDAARSADALWMPPDPTVATPEAFRFLLDLSLATRKPLLVFSDALVHAGAMVSSAPDYAVMGARAADAVRRIQGGDRAGDIPVAWLKPGRIVINWSTARALGRTLPADVERTAEVLR